MKTIVISAVNLRKGGTLTILRNCLQYLSSISHQYRIVAVVHKKELAFYPGIEYIEMPWSLKSWVHRLWCEYVTMSRISKDLSPVCLWFSLHDTTPNVSANYRAVYLQTSFPFFNWKFRDLFFDYKIPLFALLIKFAYRINIKKNNYLVVQQQWLKDGFSKMFSLPEDKFIIAPPQRKSLTDVTFSSSPKCNHFLFVSTPDCHKNFEILCKASEILEKEIGAGQFVVSITLDGSENKYSQWIHEKWQHVKSINFAGYLNQQKLAEYYKQADCLIFPSRIETWGLPISEFMQYNKPLLLADLPYAHETAAGSNRTAFFNPFDTKELKMMMKNLIDGNDGFLTKVPKPISSSIVAEDWEKLFKILLNESV